jgi:hypothetical protein
VAVKSAMPNDKPAIVKLPPPVCGMFGLHTRVTTGAAHRGRRSVAELHHRASRTRGRDRAMRLAPRRRTRCRQGKRTVEA